MRVPGNSPRPPWLPRLDGRLLDNIPDEEIPTPPPCVRQTISLFDLPPELRNRLYEEILPSRTRGDQLLIATPAWDSLMTAATQPALTLTNRQVRAESLPMFYATNDFHAFIEYTDFRPLFRWLHSLPPTLKHEIRVQVGMLQKMTCWAGLAELAKAWKATNVHIVFRSAFTVPAPGKAQCEALVAAINTAERFAAAGSEVEMERELRRQCGAFGYYDCECEDDFLLYIEGIDMKLCSKNIKTGKE